MPDHCEINGCQSDELHVLFLESSKCSQLQIEHVDDYLETIKVVRRSLGVLVKVICQSAWFMVCSSKTTCGEKFANLVSFGSALVRVLAFDRSSYHSRICLVATAMNYEGV